MRILPAHAVPHLWHRSIWNKIKQGKAIKQMTAGKWLTLGSTARTASVPRRIFLFSHFSPAHYHRHAADAIWKMPEMGDATTFCCHFEYIFHFYDEEMSIVHWTGHSFIHSGQRTEFAPIWETEINEKPHVLLILTTSTLTPWALSFTRGRNWRIRGRGS